MKNEKAIFVHIQEMIISDDFLNMIGNDKYSNKVLMKMKDEYIIGNSLFNLEHYIKTLCDQYNYDYKGSLSAKTVNNYIAFMKKFKIFLKPIDSYVTS